MEAGRLRHKVTIQSPPRAENELGEQELTGDWTNLAVGVPAFVRPLSAREAQNAQQTEAQISHVVEMRYTALVTSERRLMYGTRILNIIGVINVNELFCELQVTVSEVTT